jgi:hypothetical protein
MRSKIKEARSRVEALRVALLSSTSDEMGAALPGLDEAARCLALVEEELRGGARVSQEIRREVKLLKNDLRISGRLIEQGMAFCQSWAKMLGSGPGYTQAGLGAPLQPATTLTLRG